MRRQRVAIILVAVFLVGCGGAGARQASPSAALQKPVNPLRITATVAPRMGLALPQGTSVEVVVRREDLPDDQVAVQPLGSVRKWPAPVELSVKWPSVPAQGERMTWKAPPPVLRVFAQGFVAGRLTYISSPQPYTVEDSLKGRPVNLVLVPIFE